MSKRSEVVLITGASGLVGSNLVPQLKQLGFELRHLSYSATEIEGSKLYQWDPVHGKIDTEALQGVDYIIHLAGAGIADKAWTSARKQLIIDSRVKSSQLLLETCKSINHFPKKMISSSAIGIYTHNENVSGNVENALYGKGFLAESCIEWENAIKEWADYCGLAMIRTGVVLDREGGALAEMLKQFKQGATLVLGNGKQRLSWIHKDDLIAVYTNALLKDWEGPINAVAANPETLQEFSLKLALILDKGLFPFKVPAFLLRMAIGERADLLLADNYVIPGFLQKKKFKFKYPKLKPALQDLIIG